jgi:hypothetical protein
MAPPKAAIRSQLTGNIIGQAELHAAVATVLDPRGERCLRLSLGGDPQRAAAEAEDGPLPACTPPLASSR